MSATSARAIRSYGPVTDCTRRTPPTEPISFVTFDAEPASV